MSDGLIFRSRLTSDRWRLAVEELGDVLAAKHQQRAARVRSIIPLPDVSRFILGSLLLGGVCGIGILMKAPPWFSALVGVLLLLFGLAYLPRVRRGAASYAVSTSRSRARSMLLRFEPIAPDGVEYEYQLSRSQLLTRAEGHEDEIVNLDGARAIMTSHVVVLLGPILPIAVAFCSSHEDRDRCAKYLAETCGLGVAG